MNPNIDWNGFIADGEAKMLDPFWWDDATNFSDEEHKFCDDYEADCE